ncbi:hypothetical protein CDL15_Pgr014158 [Punica granatum]|uniref:Uncharacterized protein n=1 Tax=Punica granatum TaxID=22663 RepID=A0A218XIF0_PUNGR|nr:hypothetical protein CDL15_Pgr014158 [Punica granatum]
MALVEGSDAPEEFLRDPMMFTVEIEAKFGFEEIRGLPKIKGRLGRGNSHVELRESKRIGDGK